MNLSRLRNVGDLLGDNFALADRCAGDAQPFYIEVSGFTAKKYSLAGGPAPTSVSGVEPPERERLSIVRVV